MSGTAVAVSEYLRTHYSLDAGRIPSHKLCIREDRPEQIYATAAQRDAAVVAAAAAAHSTGQPLLVGTHSVAASEREQPHSIDTTRSSRSPSSGAPIAWEVVPWCWSSLIFSNSRFASVATDQKHQCERPTGDRHVGHVEDRPAWQT